MKTARMFWGLREATFNTEASSSSELGKGSPPEVERGSRTDAHQKGKVDCSRSLGPRADGMKALTNEMAKGS